MKSSLQESVSQSEKPDNSHLSHKNSHAFDLQKIIDLFQNCKSYFSEDIGKQYGPQKSKKKNSETQNLQLNQGLYKKDHQILNQIQQACRSQFSQFHFDDEEKQIIFQEGLLLCVSMIQKFQNSHNYKKSRSINRFLTKALLLLSRFLIEKISNMMKKDFGSIFSMTLEILLQNNFKVAGPNQKSKNSKKDCTKLNQFEISLILTGNKVPFCFYFIFSLLQQSFLTDRQHIKKNKTYAELNDYVLFVCEKILEPANQDDSLSILIKSVCQIFGCIQFPIAYLFYTSLITIAQRKFSEKYEGLNSQLLQSFRMDKEVFSLKNLVLMLEALIKHDKCTFRQIRTEVKKTVFQENDLQAEKEPCILCSAVLEERIILSFLQNSHDSSDLKNQSICAMKLTYCHDCYFDGQTHKLEDLEQKKMEQHHGKILADIFTKSFWRQQFQLQQIRKFKDINLNLLHMEEKIQINEDQMENYVSKYNLKSLLSQNQIAFMALKSLFSFESQSKKWKVQKKLKPISLKSHQEKLITLLLIMINSKSEVLRLQVIQSLSKRTLLEYFTQYLTSTDILEIIQKDQIQDSLKKNDSQSQLKGKIYTLFNQIRDRIHDMSETIQTQVIKFLLKISQIYPQTDLKIKTIQFILENYLDKINSNNFKNLPINAMKIIEEEIELSCRNLDRQDKISSIITAKHMINLVLTLIFTFFDKKSSSNHELIIAEDIRENVSQVRRLIDRLLFLICEQEKQMKIVSNNSQYQNLVISFLKKFSFNKTTINCFKFNDSILQKLIELTEIDQGHQKEGQLDVQFKNKLLFLNLRLILEQLFEFNKQVSKSSVISKSIQKKSMQKNKNTKVKHLKEDKILETESSHFTFSYKDPTFNLNKVIKNILKRQAKLTPLNCDILFFLIQKNILLNYESETNFSDTPSKVKRLILSLETIRKFHEILKFLENEIKQCNVDFLCTYIQLYVSICIQINEEKKIQMIFNYYLNVFRYFKKIWLTEYESALENHYQFTEEKTSYSTKNYNFFLRTIRTISIIGAEFQKFKKIHNITQEYFSEIKNTKINEKKYSIFTVETQDAINSLQTEPEESFIKLYQEIYDLFDFLTNREILSQYMELVDWSLISLGSILNIHPHLFVRFNPLFKALPSMMEMKSKTIENYLKIFSFILVTGDSILMSFLSRPYDNIKDIIWSQNQNESLENYQNFQTFCEITFTLLKEDIISFLDVTPFIFYCIFIRNKKINDWAKEYLQYLNKKGNDGILFNNFERTMMRVSSKLEVADKYYFTNKQYFLIAQILGKINKDMSCSQKLYLQKDLKEIKMRSTIVKKISEVLSNSLEAKKIEDNLSYQHLILMLKILENQKQMDVYECQQIVETLEKVIRENYLLIMRTQDGARTINQNEAGSLVGDKQTEQTQDEFDKDPLDLCLKIEKRRMLFVVGQVMYTLIKLINEKKLKRFKQDLQKLIETKKFNSFSINFKVNCSNERQLIDHQKKNDGETSTFILNYQESLQFYRYIDYIRSLKYDQIDQTLMDLTKNFKNLARKMYNILFHDEKPRILKTTQFDQIRKKKESKNHIFNDSDQEYSQYTESEYTQRSASRQNSLSKGNSKSSNKGTKRIYMKSNPLTKNDCNATKKLNHGAKNFSHSVPKKIESKLSTINQETNNDEDHVKWSQRQSRRSKRIMEREKSKKTKRTSQLR